MLFYAWNATQFVQSSWKQSNKWSTRFDNRTFRVFRNGWIAYKDAFSCCSPIITLFNGLHLLKSYTKAIRQVLQIITYVCCSGKQRLALVEPCCKYWSCCGWQKGTTWDKVMLSGEKFKPVAIAIIELRLSEGISNLVSKYVSQSVIQWCPRFLKFILKYGHRAL